MRASEGISDALVTGASAEALASPEWVVESSEDVDDDPFLTLLFGPVNGNAGSDSERGARDAGHDSPQGGGKVVREWATRPWRTLVTTVGPRSL